MIRRLTRLWGDPRRFADPLALDSLINAEAELITLRAAAARLTTDNDRLRRDAFAANDRAARAGNLAHELAAQADQLRARLATVAGDRDRYRDRWLAAEDQRHAAQDEADRYAMALRGFGHAVPPAAHTTGATW